MDNDQEASRSDRQREPEKKGYQEIVEHWLGIKEDFFISHSKTILDSLRAAAKALTGSEVQRDISHNLIDACLHIASSVVLLESKAADVNKALQSVRASFPRVPDATLVVTACTLYYIMHDHGEPVNSDRNLQTIHRYFDQIQWLIGEDAMETLDIEPLKEVGAQP